MKKAIICQKTAAKFITTINLVFAALAISNVPAQALSFNFTYASGTRQEVIDGFEKAGSLWSSKLQDTYIDSSCLCQRDTTINIFINFGELSNSKALGGARPGMVRVNYNDFVTKSFQDISSADDLLAVKNLQINNIQRTTESMFSSLGITKYDTDVQARNVLTQFGFTLDSNQTITAQSQNIFNQLTLEQIQNLNRQGIQLNTSQFGMAVNNTDAIALESADKLRTIDSETIIDSNGNDNNKKIWLSRANAKALNIIQGNDKGFDGQIVLSNSMLNQNGDMISYSNWTTSQSGEGDFRKDSIWDFSRIYSDSATVDSNKYDFLTVAQHEIGHILGVVSGVDAVDVLKNMMTAEGAVTQPLQDKNLQFVSSMDLFRHSDTTKNKGIFDWTHGDGKYFSIDGGVTKLAEFDGTNYQGSHWSAKVDSPLGIMHPVLKKGQSIDISDLDTKLLDVIGWDPNSSFADKTGVNLDMETANGAIASKVKSIGLDWKKLEDLLTKPAAAYLSEMAQERAAIAPFQTTRLQTELQANKTQLAIEQAALKLEQDKTKAQLDTKLKELSTLTSQQTNLQKQQTDLQSTLSSNNQKITELQTKLAIAKPSDQPKIQAEIDKLLASNATLQNQVQTIQSQLTSLQPQIQSKQQEVSNLQTQLNNLQTTPSIEVLKLVVSDLDARLKSLNSLENTADGLASKADPVIIKEKLAQLKSTLDVRLSNLTNIGDGPKRRQEEQNILAQIVKLAQEQEKAWNLVITAHEFGLFSGVDAQVRQWLQASPEELKNHMTNATRKQTLLLVQAVDSASGEQKAQWQAKVQKALMLLNNIDEDKANKLLAKVTKILQKTGANDNPMTRLSSGSTSTGWRYWQEMDLKSLDASLYTETVYTAESGLENATLNQLFYSKLEELEAGDSQAASVPEPSAIAGLSVFGLLGIGRLFQHRRK